MSAVSLLRLETYYHFPSKLPFVLTDDSAVQCLSKTTHLILLRFFVNHRYQVDYKAMIRNRYNRIPHEPGYEKTCLMSYANNKGADQPADPRSLISAFVVRCLDSAMSLVSVTKISSLMLASVAQ